MAKSKIKIKNTRDFTLDRVRILVYGQSGTKKTRFAATWPKPFFIAAEKGLLSIVDEEVDYFEVNKYKDMDTAYEYLLSSEAKGKYETVVIDSLTDLQAKLMAHILKDAGREFPEIRDWGVMLEMMRRFLLRIGDLPYNVVLIALEGDMEDEDTGIIASRPAIQGKAGIEVPAFVDFVMRTVCEKKKRGGVTQRRYLGQFQPALQYAAKDRSGRLPEELEDPTADKILSLLTGRVGSGKSATAKTKAKKKRK